MNVLSLFDGKYEVSDTGKVFSLARESRRELVGKVGNNGYRSVLLTVDGKRLHRLVHRLVAEAFIPNTLGKRTVNHRDGCKLNNNVENLEWMTDSENLSHAREKGLLNTKISRCIANKIKEEEGTNRFLAEKYGVSKTLVGQIKNGERWA